jgi:hypothetical protein
MDVNTASGSALDAEVPVRNVHGGLFVLDLNVFRLSRRYTFAQRVEKPEYPVAGNAEHVGHALALEIVHDNLSARAFHLGLPPFVDSALRF